VVAMSVADEDKVRLNSFGRGGGSGIPLKEWINEVLKTESTPFKEAKVELSKDRKRADILLLDNNSQVVVYS